LWVMGFEEDGTAQQGKKHAGGMFFSPGENPWTDDGRLFKPVSFVHLPISTSVPPG